MNNKKLNKALMNLDHEHEDGEGRLCWGWSWRDIDLSEPLRLAVSHAQTPGWWGSTFEAQVGIPYHGRQVRICMNNKWDYDEVTPTPEQDTEIKAALVTYARSGLLTDRAAAFALMQEVGK